MKFEVKFPCGYEVKIKQGFFQMFFVGRFIPVGDLCPIHGIKCRKEIKK